MATLKEQFGARLRDFRLQKRMVQKDFAAFLGVSADHVSALERGISGPSFDTLERIADRLGVSVGELLTFPPPTRRRRRARRGLSDESGSLVDASGLPTSSPKGIVVDLATSETGGEH